LVGSHWDTCCDSHAGTAEALDLTFRRSVDPETGCAIGGHGVAERKWFKGRAAVAVDAWYSAGDVQANLEQARAYLQSDRSFSAIVEDLDAAGRGKSEFVHPHERSSLKGPRFESVARQGYLEAIALALLHDPPVPIKSYWMTGAGNDQFEMHVTDEADQVSVTLFVPEVEGGTERGPESWVVRIGHRGDVQTERTSGPLDLRTPSTRDAAAD
jgi:hypothetical protein